MARCIMRKSSRIQILNDHTFSGGGQRARRTPPHWPTIAARRAKLFHL